MVDKDPPTKTGAEQTAEGEAQEAIQVIGGGTYTVAPSTLLKGASFLSKKTAQQTRSLVLAVRDNTQSTNFTIGMIDPDNQVLSQRVADELEVPWRALTIIKLDKDDFINLFQTAYLEAFPQETENAEENTSGNWQDLIGFQNKKTEKNNNLKNKEEFPSLGEKPAESEKDFVQQIMRTAISLGASDIHFDVGPKEGMVRMRIDGILYPKIRTESGLKDFTKITNETMLKMNGALAAAANTDYEMMLNTPQDGSLVLHYKTTEGDTKDTRIRFASIPRKIDVGDQRGAKVTLRVNQKMITDINQLGLEPEVRDILVKGVNYIGGIGLIIGSTGSGKTNILASLHTILRKDLSKNIMSFEDTVEQMFDGMCQTEVSQSCSEADIIKSFLRHDPDILIGGEVRDSESTSKLVEIATAGKLVLSTLHANNLAGAFIRLEQLGVDRYIQSETLRFLVFTTLVRKLCEHCKVKGYRLRNFETECFEYIANDKGCAYCRFVGYRGRTAIAEALIISPSVAENIASGLPGAVICQKAEEEGCLFSLERSILQKISSGITSKAEVLRVIDKERRAAQNSKVNKKTYNWQEQPSKRDFEERTDATPTTNKADYSESISGNDIAYADENVIDVEEINENDFEVNLDWKEGEIDELFENFDQNNQNTTHSNGNNERELKTETAFESSFSTVNNFQPTQELNSNGHHKNK